MPSWTLLRPLLVDKAVRADDAERRTGLPHQDAILPGTRAEPGRRHVGSREALRVTRPEAVVLWSNENLIEPHHCHLDAGKRRKDEQDGEKRTRREEGDRHEFVSKAEPV